MAETFSACGLRRRVYQPELFPYEPIQLQPGACGSKLSGNEFDRASSALFFFRQPESGSSNPERFPSPGQCPCAVLDSERRQKSHGDGGIQPVVLALEY